MLNFFNACLKISFPVNNFIRNNITRILIIFGINKIDVSYCLSSNIITMLQQQYTDKIVIQMFIYTGTLSHQ